MEFLDSSRWVVEQFFQKKNIFLQISKSFDYIDVSKVFKEIKNESLENGRGKFFLQKDLSFQYIR